MVPLLLLYTNRLHSVGWNSEAVITSVNSSILAGLISTISKHLVKEKKFFFPLEDFLVFHELLVWDSCGLFPHVLEGPATSIESTLFKWYLFVLEFNTILTTEIIWQSVTHHCFLAFSHQSEWSNFTFQSHWLPFSHVAAVTGEKLSRRMFAATWYQTSNLQVKSLMLPTETPGPAYLTQSHTMTPYDAPGNKPFENTEKRRNSS